MEDTGSQVLFVLYSFSPEYMIYSHMLLGHAKASPVLICECDVFLSVQCHGYLRSALWCPFLSVSICAFRTVPWAWRSEDNLGCQFVRISRLVSARISLLFATAGGGVGPIFGSWCQ